MAEKKLMVVIGAKASEFNRVMGQVKKDTRAISKTFTDVGRDMTAVGKSMTAAITVPIIAVGGFALKTGIEFESAFAGVRKTVDATEGELAELSDGIRAMAKEIPAAATEIAGVAEAAGQLGIETDNILGFTRVMIDLGEATNLSGEEAATALARLANITQMSQKDFDRLGSTVVALGNNLATTESEIVEMGLRLAGAGKQVGMTEAQILGFAGALSSVGIEAQAGGSAFSKVMVEMQLAVETGSAKLDEFANVAGMTSEEFSRAFKEDAAGAIIAFIEGLGTAEERGMSAIAVLDEMDIKEVRLRDALLRAAGAGDLFNESIAIGTQAWEENTALTTEAEQRYETTAAQIEILKNKFTDLGIELYDKIGPVLKDTIIPMADKLIEAIGKLVEWFTNLSPAVQKFLIIAAGIAAAAGPVLIIVGQIATAIGTLIPIISKVIAVVKIVGAAIAGVAGGPVLLIIAAIAALIAIGVAVWKNWDTIKAFAIKIWGYISDFFTTTWGNIKTTAITIFNNIKNTITTAFNNAWAGIKNAFSGVKTFFNSIWTGIKNAFSSVTTWFKNTSTNAWTAVKNVFSTGGKIFTGIKDGISSTFKTIVNGLINGINRIIRTPFNAINSMLNRIRNVGVMGLKPFSGLWGYNPLSVPQIPKLARGGLITSPILAGLGEAGREVVLPLDSNTSWADIVANKLASALQGAPLAGAGVGGGDIYVYIGNEQVDAYVYRAQDRRNVRSNGR